MPLSPSVQRLASKLATELALEHAARGGKDPDVAVKILGKVLSNCEKCLEIPLDPPRA